MFSSNNNIAQVVLSRVISAAALLLTLSGGASPALAESYDEEAHRIVDEMDTRVNSASSRTEALNYAWMIEASAREIRHAHPGSENTVHWMRLRYGEIMHYINKRWPQGATAANSPNKEKKQPTLCGTVVRDGSSNGKDRYRAIQAGVVWVVTSNQGRVLSAAEVRLSSGNYVLLNADQGISCHRL